MTTTLVIESCPLHTERPEWAVHAPAQVTAACKRGAHVIGLTEVHKATKDKIQAAAEAHGYHFYYGLGGPAILYKKSLTDVHTDAVHDAGTRTRSQITFKLGGNTITVFACHWATNSTANKAVRDAQTKSLIKAMDAASAGSHVAFYLADSNPTVSLRRQGSPQKQLRLAGLPLIYDEVGFPKTPVGVTTIGRNKKDGHVHAVKVVPHPALGSDHQPMTGTYLVGVP
jgi:hypothetical protein